MEKYKLVSLDTFTVINRTIINDSDRDILIMLYQPIIGSTAINLYLTLWSYLDKISILSDTYNHQVLANQMGITLSEVLESREKIEGVGLLKTHIKQDEINNYVYELYAPVSAYEFFSNPLLSTVLYTVLGATEFKRLNNCFKIPAINLKEYTNITVSFSDIFASKTLMEANADNIKRRNTKKIKIDSVLNIENVLGSILDTELVQSKVTDQIKDLILKLSYVYDFNEEQTINVIKNSINENHMIDKELLRVNYHNYYQFENMGSIPSIVYKTQPDALKKELIDISAKSKAIYQFENISPYKFLCIKNKTTKPAPSELAIIEYLLVDLGLLPGVVNVLLDYVLKINNNKLTKNFVNAIASQWKRNNIKTVEEAMKTASDEYKSKKNIKTTTTKYKKVESTPEWLNKNIEVSEDEEKSKKIEEMLSRL